MRWHTLARPATACVLIVAVYYLVPIEPGESGPRLLVRAALTVVGLILVGWLIVHDVRGQVAAADTAAGPARLAVALVAGLSVFALADYGVAVARPDQFAELTTKTDAMYFALATLATVGYGDVHPTGQLARLLVSLQMAFNLVVLATGASVFVNLLTERVRARRDR
jgi:hypothetical protein